MRFLILYLILFPIFCVAHTEVDIIQKGEKLLYSKPDSFLIYSTEVLETTNSNIIKAKLFEYKAVLFFRKGKYINAEKHFKKALLLLKKNKIQNAESIFSIYVKLAGIERKKGNQKQAINILETIINQSKKLNLKQALSDAINYRGIIYRETAQYEKSVQLYKAAIKIREDNNIISGLGNMYSNLGLAYLSLSKQDSALLFLLKAKDFMRKHQNNLEICSVYSNIGVYYYRNRLNEKAVNSFLIAADYAQKYELLSTASILNNNIGAIYYLMGDMDNAEIYYNKALETRIKINDFKGIAGSYNNLGNLALEQKKHNKAINYFNKSIARSRQIDNYETMAMAYNNLGNTYKAINKIQAAIDAFQKALEIKQQINKKDAIYSTLINLSVLHTDLQNFKKAEYYLGQAKKLASQENFKLLSDLHNSYYSYYLKKGNKDSALFYFQEYTRYKDSLLVELNEVEINKIVSDHEKQQQKEINEKLKKENEIKTLKLNKRYNTIIAMTFGVFSIFIILFVVFRNIRLRDKNKQIGLEYTLLITQMNPHFIYNALAGLQGLIYEDKKKEAVKYIHEISTLFRGVLEKSHKELIAFDEEIKLLGNYLNVQQKRYSNIFEYKITNNIDIETFNLYIPPMMIQPFIENSIEHGLQHIEHKKGMLNIQVNKTKRKTLLIEISDNGIGREAAKQFKKKEKESFATKIYRKRKKILEKKYKLKKLKYNYTDLFDNEGKAIGTKVEIELPLIIK